MNEWMNEWIFFSMINNLIKVQINIIVYVQNDKNSF